MLPSNRNQSIDLLRKSIDWFLYEGNTGIYSVKHIENVTIKVFRNYQLFRY